MTACIPEPQRAVDGRSRDLDGEAGEKARHTGHVAVVFTRLVGRPQ